MAVCFSADMTVQTIGPTTLDALVRVGYCPAVVLPNSILVAVFVYASWDKRSFISRSVIADVTLYFGRLISDLFLLQQK